MNALAIETSGAVGSVAACSDGTILAEETLGRGMKHGRMLVPLVERIVAQAGWDRKKDIDLVVVSRGPGSFTGLRVGITCAKTMAVFLAKPIIGVCSFDGMAENALPEYDRVLIVLDAKRGDVYTAAYERRNDRLERVHDPAIAAPVTAAGLLPAPYLVIGDALRRHAQILCGKGGCAAEEELWRVRASVIAWLGLAAFRTGRRDDQLALQPMYLRLPEAEERRLVRERSKS